MKKTSEKDTEAAEPVVMRNRGAVPQEKPGTPPDAGDHAAWANLYHKKAAGFAHDAVQAAINAGLELLRAKEKCGRGMFLDWVRKNCDFSQGTAHKYMALCQMAVDEAEMPKLIEEDAGHVTVDEDPGMKSRLDGRGLSELYAAWGIVTRSSNLGGKREGAGRPKKGAEERVLGTDEDPDMQAEIGKALVGKLYNWAVTMDGIGKLKTDALAVVERDIAEIAKHTASILDARRRVERGR